MNMVKTKAAVGVFVMGFLVLSAWFDSLSCIFCYQKSFFEHLHPCLEMGKYDGVFLNIYLVTT